MSISPDGRRVATGGSNEGRVRIYDVELKREIKAYDVGGTAVYSIGWDARGRHVLASGSEKAFKRIDLETGEIKSIDENVGHIPYFDCSRDGRYLAGTNRQKIIVWDARTWKELHRFEGHRRGSMHVSFSADGRTLASTGNDGFVRAWDCVTGKEIATFGDGRAVNSRLRFTADGRRLVVCGSDGRLHVFGEKSGVSNGPVAEPKAKDPGLEEDDE